MFKISILIPIKDTYLKYFKECINSIKAQSFRDWNCLIYNDGSTHEDLLKFFEELEQDKRFKIIHSNTNQGVSHARNVLIDSCEAEYGFLFDSDDVMTCNCLATALQFAEYNKVDILNFEKYVTNKPAMVRYPDEMFYIFEFFLKILATGPNIFRTSLLKKYSHIRYCEDLVYGEDLFFHYTLYTQTLGKWAILHNPIMYYRKYYSGEKSYQEMLTPEEALDQQIKVLNRMMSGIGLCIDSYILKCVRKVLMSGSYSDLGQYEKELCRRILYAKLTRTDSLA